MLLSMSRASFHLKTGPQRVACGTRRWQTYVDAERFAALPVEHRCVKCDAKFLKRATVAASS
jgi:hypothetical protein